MARIITLKFSATCADCGASLAPGDTAAFYGRGRVYGRTCHADPGRAVKAGRRAARVARSTDGASGDGLKWWGGQRVRATQCEDAPCCGCCGPGTDDPAYAEPSDPSDYYDR